MLALQGDFAAHARALARAGVPASEIRRPAELAQVDALVIPGGESTTLVKLLRELELWEAVRAMPASGRPLFGTCAGLILLSQEVSDPPQPSLGLLAVRVTRNAYGRQIASFVASGRVRVPADLPLPLGLHGNTREFATDFVFIRAPRVCEIRDGVEVLATYAGAPVLVRQGLLLAASFHPELSTDGRVVELFVALARQARARRRSERATRAATG